MTNSHAADWGSESPSPAQLKEFFAQVQKGRITKGDVQQLLQRERLHSDDAQKILGENYVFSFEDWWEFFGKQLSIKHSEFPSSWLPWNKEIVIKADSRQKCFLFPGIATLEGNPLDLKAWEALISSSIGPGPRFCLTSYQWTMFSGTCQTRWYLMPIGPYIGTCGESFERQKAILGENYEIPSAIERTTANFLFWLKNYKYLDSHRVRTCEFGRALGTDITGAINISSTGLIVYPVTKRESEKNTGLAASLKIPEF